LEINNWLDFIQYTAFTLGVLLVLIPIGVNFTYSGVKFFIKYGVKKLPKDVTKFTSVTYAYEMLFIGFFAVFFSIWYLFFDNVGNLYNYFLEVKKYFML